MRRGLVVLGIVVLVLAVAAAVLAMSSLRSSLAHVHGRVLRGGVPVPGATVWVNVLPRSDGGGTMWSFTWISPPEFQVVTDAQGRYDVRVRTDGEVMFTPIDPQTGRDGGGLGFSLEPGADQELDLNLAVPRGAAPPAQPTPR